MLSAPAGTQENDEVSCKTSGTPFASTHAFDSATESSPATKTLGLTSALSTAKPREKVRRLERSFVDFFDPFLRQDIETTTKLEEFLKGFGIFESDEELGHR